MLIFQYVFIFELLSEASPSSLLCSWWLFGMRPSVREQKMTVNSSVKENHQFFYTFTVDNFHERSEMLLMTFLMFWTELAC